MSPLIHRSLTWSIVGTVVSLSTWLAGNVQQAHDRQGLRLSAVSAQPATAVPAANRTASADRIGHPDRAAHVLTHPTVRVEAEATVQLASNR